MRRLALALWLFSPTPLAADESACLAAPDRACLYSLAQERALGQDELDDIVGDLMAIAVSEEKAGSDRALATLDQLLALLAEREPDGLKRIAVLNGAVLGAEMAGAPKVAAALARAVAGMETEAPVERDRLELRALAYAGDIRILRERVMAADAGQQAGLALAVADALMQSGDYAAAFGMADVVGLEEFQADLDETAVILLLRQGEIEAARVAAARATDRATQALALARIARVEVQAGQREAARKRLAEIEAVIAGGERSVVLQFAEADVLARLGERERAEERLAALPPEAIAPRRLAEVRGIAALVAGDVEGLLATVATAERPAEGGFWVKSAVTAALQAGQGDIEPVLTRLAAEPLSYGLNAAGLHQAQAGDLVAALDTLARLHALGEVGRVHGDFRAALARLLLQSGKVTEGVALAAEGNDPRLIAEIAGMLP